MFLNASIGIVRCYITLSAPTRGDLVLGKVLVDGEQTEHHYWNRIDGEDFDLTQDQFVDGEDIVEAAVVENEFLKINQETLKPELVARIEVMRGRVKAKLKT